MNERIQLLKQRAGIDFNPDQEGLDQFAELIVRECAESAKIHLLDRPYLANTI